MDQVEQKLIKPTRRWFQYRLKTLMLLPVFVGLLLIPYVYWDNWRRQRPPYQKYDDEAHQALFNQLDRDLRKGRTDDAYELTSARFRERFSQDDFKKLVSAFTAIYTQKCDFTGHVNTDPLPPSKDGISMRRWSAHQLVVSMDRKVVELWVWVVMEDSLFNTQPPLPRIEDVQVQEFSELSWITGRKGRRFDGDRPPPSWEQE